MEQIASQDMLVFTIGFIVGVAAYALFWHAVPAVKNVLKSPSSHYIKQLETHTDLNLHLIQSEEGQSILKRFFVSELLLESELIDIEKALSNEKLREELIDQLKFSTETNKKAKSSWQKFKSVIGKTKDKTLGVLNNAAKDLASKAFGGDDV